MDVNAIIDSLIGPFGALVILALLVYGIYSVINNRIAPFLTDKVWAWITKYLEQEQKNKLEQDMKQLELIQQLTGVVDRQNDELNAMSLYLNGLTSHITELTKTIERCIDRKENN